MASASFKTPCPSCEAGVLVKDESMIGKKIDCPKCKYRFVVEAPNGKETTTAAKKSVGVSVKARPDAKAAPATKTAVKTKPVGPPPEEEEKQEKTKDRSKKPKGFSNKMLLRLGLAGLGVVVLAIAAFLILKKSDPPRKNPIAPRPNVQPGGESPNPSAQADSGKDPKKKTQPKAKVERPVPQVALSAAGPELTNLLPADTQHVLHVFVKETLDAIPLLADATFQAGALGDEGFKQRLGFSLKSVDDLICAENYAAPWVFTAVHLKEAVEENGLKEALGLAPAAGSPMNRQEFYKVTKNNRWVEQIARLSLGTLPPPATSAGKSEDRPLFVRIHDPQTLVFADAAPMQKLLEGGASIPSGELYARLKPALKAMLDKMERLPPDSTDRVLLSAVTDLEAARMDAPPGRVQWRFRHVWDVAHALPDNPQRLRLIGSSLIRKGKREPATYRYQNEVECAGDAEARTVQKDLRDKVAPDVERFLGLMLGLKIDVADVEADAPPMNPTTGTPSPPPSQPGGSPPGGRPYYQPGGYRPPFGSGFPGPTGQVVKEPVKADPAKSHVLVLNTDKNVVFTLNLVIDEKALPRVGSFADLLMVGLRSQLEAASGISHRNDLARAEKLLGEQGTYPPGVFPRKTTAVRSARDPGQRISWMAALLPHLGQEALYGRIKFDASWKDSANWMSARTLVPEFLDPTYPDWARFAPYPGIPFPLGGTHFVGIAGVGQDAPDYSAGDPTVAAKLGVFGYDRMTSLEEIKKNRGLSHTGVMVQVPYNGPTGVTPWMAGGGSTLRGVPEKDSVKPFISTTHNGKAGTFLLMADGSVRFVGADVKDEVFKALCTIKGPAEVAGLDREAPVVQGSK